MAQPTDSSGAFMTALALIGGFVALIFLLNIIEFRRLD
jgi:hypothetical protein